MKRRGDRRREREIEFIKFISTNLSLSVGPHGAPQKPGNGADKCVGQTHPFIVIVFVVVDGTMFAHWPRLLAWHP